MRVAKELLARYGIYLFGFFLVVIPYLPVLLNAEQALLFRDLSINEIPMRRVWLQAIVELGRIPHWNPFVLSGNPLLADSNSRALFPLNWIFYLLRNLEVSRVAVVFILLHHLLVYLSGLFLFREFRVRPSLAVLGALSLACGGYAMSTDNLLNLLGAQIAIPIFIVFWRRALRRAPVSMEVFLAGGALGFPIYASDPQFSFMGVGIALILAFRAKLPLRAVLQRVSVLGLSACLFSAPQLLPTLAFVGETSRGFMKLAAADLTVWSLHGARLFELIFPLAFGARPDEWQHWGNLFVNAGQQTQPFIFSIYAGASLPFFHALFALCILSKRKTARYKKYFFWTAIAGFLVLATMGSFSPVPLYDWLARSLPLWGGFRYPERLAYWPILIWIFFGIFSAEKVLRLARKGSFLPVFYSFIPLIPIGIGFGYFLHLHNASLKPTISTFFVTFAIAWIIWKAARSRNVFWAGPALLLLGATDLVLVSHQLVWPSAAGVTDAKKMPWLQNIYQDQRENREKISAGVGQRFFSDTIFDEKKIQFLLPEQSFLERGIAIKWAFLQPNVSAYFLLESPRGDNSFISSSTMNFLSLWGSQPRRLLDLLSVRYMLVLKDGYPTTLVNERALPYAFVPDQIELFSDQQSVIERIKEERWNPRGSVLLETLNGSLPNTFQDRPAKVLDVKKQWDDIFIKVIPASGFWLVLNESFHKNWRAYLEGGGLAEIVRANGWAMAVRLPSSTTGKEPLTIHFRFRDPLYIPGLLCLGLWFAFTVFLLIRRRAFQVEG